MAYTGTGTQDDPYVVDSWDSYYTLANDELLGTGQYRYPKYYKFADVDNKIVDFNDIKPEGYTTPIPSKVIVDFNGWTFRNLRLINVLSVFDYQYHKYNSTWSKPSFKNGKFENIYVESLSEKFGIFSSAIYESAYNQLAVTNMSFSGTFVYKGTAPSTNLMGYSAYKLNYIHYNGCSFNFIITAPETTTNINIADNIAIENSSIKIKTQSAAEIRLAYNSFKSTIYGKILNSLVQIDSPNAVINVNNLTDGNNGNLDDRFSTCVIIPTCKELKSTAKCVTTVYNSDNVQTDSTAGSGLIPCTTEQLGSVDYLQSVGFPIGAG